MQAKSPGRRDLPYQTGGSIDSVSGIGFVQHFDGTPILQCSGRCTTQVGEIQHVA
ncbi:hypothetical protein X733_33470 [Mesorhizobium sp. L2C067A000]|nr:hypothetical protein X733_33470 [Mesorhizobium sp. L2C067A000]